MKELKTDNNNIKYAIACDQAAFQLKLEVISHLKEKGIDFIDFGTHSTDPVSYPEYAHKACEAIQKGLCDRAILICGTGLGMSMTANKHKGIRAACVSDTFSAKMSRVHNDANCLCFGARVVGKGLAFEIVDAFIETDFEGGRHQPRIDLMMSYEKI